MTALNDTDNGADAERQMERLFRRWWRQLNSYVTRKKKERRAKKLAENVADLAARRTALATVWIAIFTFVSIAVSGGTLLVLKGQLREIHESSSDTHTLAEQAKKQADKLSNMSDAAEKIRQAAENMVTQDQRIADNAQKALDASNKQSKVALDATIAQFRLDQRAWVGIGDVNTLDFEVGKNARFDVEIRNTGKTPATNVFLCGLPFSPEGQDPCPID